MFSLEDRPRSQSAVGSSDSRGGTSKCLATAGKKNIRVVPWVWGCFRLKRSLKLKVWVWMALILVFFGCQHMSTTYCIWYSFVSTSQDPMPSLTSASSQRGRPVIIRMGTRFHSETGTPAMFNHLVVKNAMFASFVKLGHQHFSPEKVDLWGRSWGSNALGSSRLWKNCRRRTAVCEHWQTGQVWAAWCWCFGFWNQKISV